MDFIGSCKQWQQQHCLALLELEPGVIEDVFTDVFETQVRDVYEVLPPFRGLGDAHCDQWMRPSGSLCNAATKGRTNARFFDQSFKLVHVWPDPNCWVCADALHT